MSWKELQQQAAEFFRSLGCQADIEAAIEGARGKHKVDVWVCFRKFGLQAVWIIECKCWNVAVPKEKVLALKSIVEDVGADRGILISTAGFQSGAVRASRQTNITLTGLDELKETVKYALHDLYGSQQTGPNSWTSKPHPGVDGKAASRAIGSLAILEHGFDRARLKQPPYPVRFDDSGERKVVVSTLDEFVTQASTAIAEAEATLDVQHRAMTK